MDIYRRLTDDHRHISALIDRLLSLSESETSMAQAVLKELSRELVSHSRAEEAVFYNSLRQCADERALGRHGFTEHVEIEGLLRSLQFFGCFNGIWISSLNLLAEKTKEHFSHEENTLFTIAKLHFTDEEADIIGTAFAELKNSARPYSLVESSLQLVANFMPGRFALNVDVLKHRLLEDSREDLRD